MQQTRVTFIVQRLTFGMLSFSNYLAFLRKVCLCIWMFTSFAISRFVKDVGQLYNA